MMMDSKSVLPSYPDLERIAKLDPGPQILLGKQIYWQEKRDGTQLRIAWVGEKDSSSPLLISTRHQEEASRQFHDAFLLTPQAASIWTMLWDSWFGDLQEQLVVFGELLVKGKSPTRIELHEENSFVIFDVWSLKQARFLSYTAAYQWAYHYGIPFVECWALTSHLTLESLYAQRDEVLALAKEKGREGTVLKTFGDMGTAIYAKEKNDLPVIPKVGLEDGRIILPVLPDSEVYGAIAKAHADLGEGFDDKAKAMPLIAKYVVEEQDKHVCSKPGNLFHYYLRYKEERG